ncbi:MAG: hypothetical protein AAFV88_04825 [Planctomycetota bacterium]
MPSGITLADSSRSVPDRSVPDRSVPDRSVPDRSVPDRSDQTPAKADWR